MFANFWLMSAVLVGIGGGLMQYVLLEKHVAAGSISAQERVKWVTGWTVVFSVLPLLLWGIGLTVSSPSNHPLEWPAPQRYWSVGVIVGTWVIGLAWIWFGAGARVLSRMFRLTSVKWLQFLLTESAIKVWTFFVVLLGALGMMMRYGGLNQ